MKILYAIQGTGNGHVARAREIIPLLLELGEVDVFLGGDQSEVALPVPVKYRSRGLTFIYNRSGAVSYLKTIFKNNLAELIRDLWNCPVKEYDVVINDFEFVTAWSAKLKGVPVLGMGHQVSFLSLRTPRPKKKEWLGEFILKNYAPCTVPVGFHFEPYEDFIYPPVIRKEVRELRPLTGNHITVYLPAYGDAELQRYFSQLPGVNWEVFSKFAKSEIVAPNVRIRPVKNEDYLKSLENCCGLLTSAGFEAPAEAMHLGKKVAVVPIANQYEQSCNAAAMLTMGVPVIEKLDAAGLEALRRWLAADPVQQVEFPDITQGILHRSVHSFYQRFALAKHLQG